MTEIEYTLMKLSIGLFCIYVSSFVAYACYRYDMKILMVLNIGVVGLNFLVFISNIFKLIN